MSLRDELLRRFPALELLASAAGEPGPFVVGGAIRDLLRGRAPADVDVTCRDAGSCAEAVAGRRIPLGRGELTALRVLAADGLAYDFTSMAGSHIVADLERRDFTVNAMAVHLGSGGFVDPFGGEADLRTGILRMIRPSNFDDDPLRLLKAVRMAVLHELTIEQETLDAIRARARLLPGVAPERVLYELSLILGAGALREAVALLVSTGLDEPLQLSVPPLFHDDVPLAGALAILVPDPAGHAARWRWGSRLLRDVAALKKLIGQHDLVSLFDAGEGAARQLPAVLRALGSSEEIVFPEFSTKSLLTGDRIAALTGLAGPGLGVAKRALLHAQVRGDVATREDAERFVQALRAAR